MATIDEYNAVAAALVKLLHIDCEISESCLETSSHVRLLIRH
jgi:hypothetical protein